MPTFIAPLQPTAAPQKAQQPFRAKDVAFSAPFDVRAHFFFFLNLNNCRAIAIDNNKIFKTLSVSFVATIYQPSVIVS
jgi:hypothetical protein